MTASAALVCLGALVTGCAGSSDQGWVAAGAAGPADRGDDGSRPVRPKDGVTMVPLDKGEHGKKDERGAAGGTGAAPAPGGSGSGESPDSGGAATSGGGGGGSTTPSPDGPGTGSGSGSGSGGDADEGGGSGKEPGNDSGSGRKPGGGGGSGGESPADGKPAGPAVLKASEPEDGKEGDERWCRTVTVTFSNTGGRAITGGTVTFSTHVIGSLGTDWSTVTTKRKLPAPIAPGGQRKKTWNLCVDKWRVPLGMHLETRAVKATMDK